MARACARDARSPGRKRDSRSLGQAPFGPHPDSRRAGRRAPRGPPPRRSLGFPMPVTPSTLLEWWRSLTEGRLLGGGWAGMLVLVVLFCALVDFLKIVVELFGRNEERRFIADLSQVT